MTHLRRKIVPHLRRAVAYDTARYPTITLRDGHSGELLADAVVEWLELTGRGNNPNLREDCAAFASPKGMSAQDDEIVFNGLAALPCLKEISGERLASVTDDDLLDLADEADPDDEFLLSEISALGERRRPLSAYADALADAAYHCAEAFEQLIRTRLRSAGPGYPTVALRECAHDLVASLAEALAVDAGLEPAVYVNPTCAGSDLLVSLVHRGDGVGSATVLTAAHRDAASRQAR
ncbi:MAG: hypothetical protein ACRDTT_29270 [Pseudonocardiaceae bacterium]